MNIWSWLYEHQTKRKEKKYLFFMCPYSRFETRNCFYLVLYLFQDVDFLTFLTLQTFFSWLVQTAC